LWGELAADDSLAAVLDSWDRLMEGHETGLRIADMDQDYLAAHAKAVVAVTFHITEIQGKSKLSQGESAADLDVIVQEMRAACPALAGRLADVAVPYVRRRDAAVAEARHARIVAMAQRIAGRGGNEAG
jgi:predicted FMN-binding regulatory protein PaiB